VGSQRDSGLDRKEPRGHSEIGDTPDDGVLLIWQYVRFHLGDTELGGDAGLRASIM
jgi:hypothetical protein